MRIPDGATRDASSQGGRANGAGLGRWKGTDDQPRANGLNQLCRPWLTARDKIETRGQRWRFCAGEELLDEYARWLRCPAHDLIFLPDARCWQCREQFTPGWQRLLHDLIVVGQTGRVLPTGAMISASNSAGPLPVWD
jgi:hypothetical protein